MLTKKKKKKTPCYLFDDGRNVQLEIHDEDDDETRNLDRSVCCHVIVYDII